MKTVTRGKRNGIQWTLLNQLDDLDFADDLALLSHNHQEMQEKTTLLCETLAQLGLNIHRGKTKILRTSTTNREPIKLRDEALDEVESFTYLGSAVDKQGGTDADVKTRVSKARAAFIQLRNIWSSRVISRHTKIRLFDSNVKSVLLYGAETWRFTKVTVHKIQTFVNKCLRRIVFIRWPDTIRNIDLWQLTDQRPIEEEIVHEKEMGMAGSHTSKTNIKHHTTVLDMDTPRKEETREATQHLAKRPRSRCEVDRTIMGAVRTYGK
jgi:hypothetical protein